MNADGLIWLIVIGGMVWFWRDSLRARERALIACKASCREMGVQLLDQTISGRVLGLARDRRGQIGIKRNYGFEFSVDGVGRRHGRVVLVGSQVRHMQLDMPDGSTIMGTPAGDGTDRKP